MGHSAAEMGYETPQERFEFSTRLVEYHSKCCEEVNNIINSNTIDINTIKVGDKLKIFNGLCLESKVKLNPSEKPHIVRELFSHHNYCVSSLSSLAKRDDFEVYQKDDEKGRIVIYPHAEICSRLKLIDWQGPDWISIKFFEKYEN